MDLLDAAFAAAYERAAPAAERGRLGGERQRLLQDVAGRVVDVGAGLGANLPHLGAEVEHTTLLEPSPHMAARLRASLARRRSSGDGPAFPIDTVEAPAEAMPVATASVDVVLCTLVLCTVADVPLALAEVRRVLRPGGRLLLLEHVRAEGPKGRVQDTIRPVWSWFGRGCDPSRDTRGALERAGFDTTEVAERGMPGFGPAAPFLVGAAVVADHLDGQSRG